MKIFAWILIIFGIVIVIWEGIDYGEFSRSDSENVFIENGEPIGWQTYAGGAIAVLGTLLLANCERNKRHGKED